MQETETAPQNDPVRLLIRISALSATAMAVAAGFLIWRWRPASSPLPNGGAETVTARDDAGGNGPLNRSGNGTDRTDARDGHSTVVNAAFLGAPVPVFALTERSGRTVTNKDLLGRPWAVCFIFTNCAGPCPLVTGQMKLLQDRFEGRPVRLVTITVDPERDTPERLSKYADAFGADDEQWLFLTGRQEPIYRLIRDGFRMPVQEMQGEDRKPGFEILHSTNVIHVDASGRIRGKYNARNDVETAALVRALEKELAGLPPVSGVDSPPNDARPDNGPPVSRDAESSQRSAPSSPGNSSESGDRTSPGRSPEPQGT